MPLNDNLGIPQERKKRITYRYDLTGTIMILFLAGMEQ